jgi:hypothetical protein
MPAALRLRNAHAAGARISVAGPRIHDAIRITDMRGSAGEVALVAWRITSLSGLDEQLGLPPDRHDPSRLNDACDISTGCRLRLKGGRGDHPATRTTRSRIGARNIISVNSS